MIQAPVELVSVAALSTRSLDLAMACAVDLPQSHSLETLLVLTASAVGNCSALVLLEVGLSVVVAFVAFAVEAEIAVVAAAVVLDSGEIGGPNRSVVM